MKYFFRIVAAVVLLAASVAALARPNYQNFKVSIYTRAYEVQRMADQHWLDSTWNVISSQMKVDKIYLETHRDQLIVDRPTMEKAIKFFKQKGLEVAGGITYTISEANSFETYCYSDPVERAKAKEIAEYTASLFDEVILDDFFFHDCKCEYCIAAKGDRNWTEYRLELMQDAAQNVVLGPAHAVNPKCKVVIKYPNWFPTGTTISRHWVSTWTMGRSISTAFIRVPRPATRSAATSISSLISATISGGISTISTRVTTVAAGWIRVECATSTDTASSFG